MYANSKMESIVLLSEQMSTFKVRKETIIRIGIYVSVPLQIRYVQNNVA